uniref:Uncharacterized protein n=1 Tax=uncultured marine virus TaxID=186617 RepID=A0A0F7L8L9_9VIRU|nr:hypothetical protein [uncultured marine virus]
MITISLTCHYHISLWHFGSRQLTVVLRQYTTSPTLTLIKTFVLYVLISQMIITQNQILQLSQDYRLDLSQTRKRISVIPVLTLTDHIIPQLITTESGW